MIISLALVLLCTACGTSLTYLYDDNAAFPVRVCSGACIGLAVFGLLGFLLSMFLGLTVVTLLLTSGILIGCSAFALRSSASGIGFYSDLSRALKTTGEMLSHPTRIPATAAFYIGVVLLLGRVFDWAVIDEPQGMFTGVLNNFGDLPFHLSVITSFVYGNNFPPEDPTYAGVRFTYPFLTDFISAVFVRCGASLRQSMFIENIVVAVALVGLIHRWAWELLRDRLAAILTPLIVLLNGGLGFTLVWTNAQKNDRGLVGVLSQLPASFTVIPESTWRWGNAISSLLIPQRGILLGLALSVIVFTQWWVSTSNTTQDETGETKNRNKKGSTRSDKQAASNLRLAVPVRGMLAAGIVAGLLPLVHAHSFVVVMVMGACIALLRITIFRDRWTAWLPFFIAASVLAIPQMWWSTHGSAVKTNEFFALQFGWDRGTESALWFWFKNTGIFIPLIIAAVLWRSEDYLVNKRLLFFYLPFTLCFIVPNVVKLAPWVWDNIKVLFYWWLASAPLVALLLSRLWQRRSWQRTAAAAIFLIVTLSGALDVASIALHSGKYEVFDANGIRFAELIRQQTAPRSLIVHAPVHNAPVFLSGRRSLMGYPGHIWTHGLAFAEREAQIRRIYAGAPDATRLLSELKIQYAVVGPLERSVMPVNEQFFSSFEKVGEVGAYRLYKTTK